MKVDVGVACMVPHALGLALLNSWAPDVVEPPLTRQTEVKHTHRVRRPDHAAATLRRFEREARAIASLTTADNRSTESHLPDNRNWSHRARDTEVETHTESAWLIPSWKD
jgi:hypothetical protein